MEPTSTDDVNNTTTHTYHRGKFSYDHSVFTNDLNRSADHVSGSSAIPPGFPATRQPYLGSPGTVTPVLIILEMNPSMSWSFKLSRGMKKLHVFRNLPPISMISLALLSAHLLIVLWNWGPKHVQVKSPFSNPPPPKPVLLGPAYRDLPIPALEHPHHHPHHWINDWDQRRSKLQGMGRQWYQSKANGCSQYDWPGRRNLSRIFAHSRPRLVPSLSLNVNCKFEFSIT